MAARKPAKKTTKKQEPTQKKSTQLIGAGLIAMAGYIALSLLTYHSGDPSLNHATGQAAKNLGGENGAIISDMLLQVLGLGAVVIVATIAAWGWRLFSDGQRIRYVTMRVCAFCVAMVACSLLFAFIDAPISWPVASGLGGSMGAILQNQLIPFIPDVILGLIALLFCVLTLPFAFGLKRDEWGNIYGIFLRGYDMIASAVRLVIAGLKDGTYTMKQTQSTPAKSTNPREKKKNTAPREKASTQSESAEAAKKSKAESKVSRSMREESVKQTSLGLRQRQGNYETPSVELLKKPTKAKQKLSDSSLKRNAKLLESVLDDFGVKGDITNIRPGPVVTLYELEPSAGTKSSRVIGLADDIARSMSAISARIAVIPGRNAIGIELPNQTRETVFLRELLEDASFAETKASLPMALGKDIGGEPCIVDLARMPHLLVAGTTGSGKSVGINTMIASLLYHHSPEQCKFIMIDPKMLELSIYDGIPHLLAPVVTEPGKAVVALNWAVKEMENRYRLMAHLGVRNVENYNKRLAEARRTGETLTRNVQTGFDPDTGTPITEEQEMDTNPLPFIVVIIDEMADLMLVAGKDVECSIQRLAQMARAAGIHLITATQRPSVDVITGVIKANFPTRISFQVTSKIDSRTILGEMGAEQLLGMGDMLYMAGGGKLTRVHGPFISDNEVQELVNYLKAQGEPEYIADVTTDDSASEGPYADEDESDADREIYDRAVAIVAQDRKASTSYIQRRLKIGYNRAASLIEKMEREGVVGAANHVGKREVLVRDPNEE